MILVADKWPEFYEYKCSVQKNKRADQMGSRLQIKWEIEGWVMSAEQLGTTDLSHVTVACFHLQRAKQSTFSIQTKRLFRLAQPFQHLPYVLAVIGCDSLIFML
jgi:hypothetical protein